MSAEDAHPDKHPKRDGGAADDEHGRRHKPRPPTGSGHRPRSRKPTPPLWRPGESPRDLNLEMTPDDLDCSPASRESGAAREQRHGGSREGIDFLEALGLGRSLRERLMPPVK